MMDKRSLVSVVDDDESVRESLPDLLRQFGFAAEAYPSAEAFLGSDVVSHTSCLLLDVAMPGMSGPELQQELTRRHQTMPIVFITGHGNSTIRPRLLARGAVECLLKPLSEEALLDAIETALRSPDRRAREGVMRSPGAAGSESRAPAMSRDSPVVFVVDDDVSVRESLELLILSAGWQPETFASAEDFLDRSRIDGPSCLVLDVALPNLNGLDLQKRIGDRTDMPIIFITGYGDVPTTVRAMKAGAVEFLTKPFGADVLQTAIRQAIERSRAVLAHEAELRLRRDHHASLTPREREIMALVVSGLLNKEIAAELGISEITVKAHRGRVMRKMQVASLADLVRVAAALDYAGSREQLTASRARVVATADETRRQLQRDLHDGAQQRLVHTIITLKLAKAELADSGGHAAELVDEALLHAERATAELRDLVRGLLPAALIRGGLRTGVESLIDHLPLPVEANLDVPRLPAHVETAAYFVIAEALTNVVKHAHARKAQVSAVVTDDALLIDVQDDGRGGAYAGKGSGLMGLFDRVQAAEGTLSLSSPPGQGTKISAALPRGDPRPDRR
jgi:FixJ family two-component response regulator